jgi:hypothetical protein
LLLLLLLLVRGAREKTRATKQTSSGEKMTLAGTHTRGAGSGKEGGLVLRRSTAGSSNAHARHAAEMGLWPWRSKPEIVVRRQKNLKYGMRAKRGKI